ncbi:cytochrome c [Hydrogenophaga sp.]|uniref:cytochrome c n=1 Tax=Hydrogenophaga sp. TaxID=1904254 RepID=UPI00286EA773|nr:cytochrome c [Hydrogenophaga sp.]
MKRTTPLRAAFGVCLLGCALLAAAIGWQLRADALPHVSNVPTASAEQLDRGAYLARAGNCMACHTARGGQPYAGGRFIDTPFGRVVAGNLTPDAQTGLGLWSPQAFRRALHDGRSRDGRLLVPAFPYTHTTLLSDADVDALYAHLRQLPPVQQAQPAHALRFPYNTQAALALWQILRFQPQRFVPDAARSAEWNRGAYLVNGLAHCAACHGSRDPMGGLRQAFGAADMPDGRWFAPSLRDPAQGGVQAWPTERIVALLRDGSVADAPGHATMMGPMAEVVFHSTQHLRADDLRAMAVYLKDLPAQAEPVPEVEPAAPAQMDLGQRLYKQHCADCHGAQGQGAPGAYPPLAGNRAVVMTSPVNAVQAIVSGGFAPATAGHPQPYGMPPFRTVLTPAEIAAVASFVRQSWGNRAGAVSSLDVQRVQ